MSIEFFQTLMGRKFFEADVPRLISAIEKLNKSVERLVVKELTSQPKGYEGTCRACNIESEIGTEEVPHPIDGRIHSCLTRR